MSPKSIEKIKSGYPVSYAQRRMWFLSRLESENLVNNSSIKAWLTGDLKVPLFEKAVQRLVARHEAFRTNFFQSGGGEVIQVINRYEKLKIIFYDFRKYSGKDLKNQIKTAQEENTLLRFNLSHDRLIRVSLLRIADNKYIFLMTLHHIVSDAWTLAFFWNELSEIYESLVARRKINLPNLSIQYKDYAVWEQSPRYLPQFNSQKDYWLKELEKIPALTPLPLDFTRPAVQTYNHETLVTQLDRGLVKKIEKICGELNVTNYTYLLSCLAIFLQQLNGVNDLVIGTYVANRDQAELERVAGTLLNNLALRLAPSPDKLLRNFICEANQKVLLAMANQDYPFEKLIEDLKVERAASHAPLFNVVFQVFVQDSNFMEKNFSGFRKKTEIFNSKFFQHDLTFRMGISDKKFGFDLSYNKDLFTRQSIKELAQLFQRTIEITTKNINLKIGDLKITNAKQKQRYQEKCRQSMFSSGFIKTSDLASPQQAELENKIIDIWKNVLQQEKIKRTDDFFRLGGHSLKIIQVYDSLEKIFPGQVSVVDLFNFYTPATLAEYLLNKKISREKKSTFSYRQEFSELLDQVKNRKISIEAAVDKIWDI